LGIEPLTDLKKPRLWFSIAYVVLALVGVFSLIPSPDIGVSDKSLHFITYFMLSAGFSTLVRFNRSMMLVVIGLIGYGVLLEFLQGMTEYRFMETYDMLANSAGVLCGLVVRLSFLPEWFRKIELLLFKT